MHCVVHGVTKSQTRLSDFHFHFNYFWGFSGSSDGKESACNAGDLGLYPRLGRYAGEGMATHSSILALRIPWTEESGRLQFMGSQESDMT